MKKAYLVSIDLLTRVVVDIPEGVEEGSEKEASIVQEYILVNEGRDLAENISDIRPDKEVPYGESYDDKRL